MIDWGKYFYYDETSPSFLRRNTDCWTGKGHRILKHRIGDIAGCGSSSHKYFMVTAEGKQYLAHRVIWELFNGEIPEDSHIDHIDGNRQNNSITNLRAVHKIINWRNMNKPANNTSGTTGVNLKTNTRPSGGQNQYWVASWASLDGGIRFEKNFSVIKLGYEEAFKQACDYRREKLKELNEEGAGYTERHGK